MQQRSLGKQIWRIFGPLIIKAGVAMVVETIIATLFLMPHMPELQKLFTSQEKYFQRVSELMGEMAQYSTEIAGLSAAVTIPILIWIFLKDRKRETKDTLEVKVPFWKYSMVFGVCIPLAVGLNNLLMLIGIPELSKEYEKTAEVLYAPSFPIVILCVGIVIPIMEELIFRGLIYKRIREEVSAARAMVFSSVFFCLYHSNTLQMVYALLSGFLFAYLYEKYQSFKAPLFAHIAMNVVVCVITELGGFIWMLADPMRIGVVTILCAAIGSTMFVMMREKI